MARTRWNTYPNLFLWYSSSNFTGVIVAEAMQIQIHNTQVTPFSKSTDTYLPLNKFKLA